MSIYISISGKEPDKPPVHKVVEGDNLLIVCNATQSSETQIFWKKNETGSEFRQNGPELKFIYINRKAAGDYVCYSQDITKTNVNATVVEVVNVDVLCKSFIVNKGSIQILMNHINITLANLSPIQQ